MSGIDLVLLAAAILLAGCILAWAWLRPWIHKLSQSMLWSMLFLATLPLLLRLALLVHCPVPIPTGSDGFGYVLLGDT
ncbi:MAG: hypothetical protein ACRD34_10815, partial [Bryobacteraceae bacterium]